ncbi:MAG: hypothetical protein FWB88_12615 [Defluviitaleaceae bacterium]|nr:hypothetical protein [Defluviitaleaceae bacterium]MCL2240440.1 hypothetical protein [Defluviitaleaceae bacterium]
MSNSALWSDIGNIPQPEQSAWAMSTRTPNSDLDRQAFLNLLMTQLKFQDPLNPMDDRDFMAQMAQFSALEQMQNLNHTFERSQAFGMIGREADFAFRHPVSGEWIDGYGVVQSVTAQGSDIYLLINNMDVPLSGVQVVSENPTNPMNNVLNAVNQARIQDMVGRTIQALLHNAQGEVTDFVEGVVNYIKISGNQSVLVVGNREVFPWEVASIGDGDILLNSTYFTNGDRLVGVDIRNGQAYLLFQDGGREHIERINYAMEAIKYVGRFIEHGPHISGVVESVTIRNSVPFLNVLVRNDDGDYTLYDVSYLLFLADRITRNQNQNQSQTSDE